MPAELDELPVYMRQSLPGYLGISYIGRYMLYVVNTISYFSF